MKKGTCITCKLSLLCASGSGNAPTRSDKCTVCERRFTEINTVGERMLPTDCPLSDGVLSVCNVCYNMRQASRARLKFKIREAHPGSMDMRVQVFGAVGGSNAGYQLTGELRLRPAEWHRLRYALQFGDNEQDGKFKIEFEEVREVDRP